MFDVEKGVGSGIDKIVYYGETTTSATLQTKESVQALIDASATGSEDAYTVFNATNQTSSETDCLGNNWYVKAKLCQNGTAVSIIINAGKNGAPMGFNTKICKLPSKFCGRRDVCIPVVSKMSDALITMGMTYLNAGTGQLTLGQLIPSSNNSSGQNLSTTSQEWEGAMVYGID